MTRFSWFYRQTARIEKILFHLNLSNDHVLALLSLILKGTIYGETQREERWCLMELLFSSSTKGPCITNGNLDFPKRRQVRKQAFEHEKGPKLHFDVK